MELMFMACAQSSSVDGPTGRLSLFHLLEQIQVTTFPTPLSLTLVGMFTKGSGDPDDQSVRLKIDLEGTSLLDSAVAFSFKGRPRTRVVTAMNNLGITGPGILSFSFHSSSGERMGSAWTVIVEKVQAPAQAPAPAPAS